MRSTSPFPVALLVTASVLALTQLVTLFIALRKQRQTGGQRWTWAVTALCFGAPLAVLAVLVLGVHDGRAQSTEIAAIARDPSDARLVLPPPDTCWGLCVSGLQKILGGLVLAATGLFGATVAVVCWHKSDRPQSVKRVAVVAAVGLALTALAYGGGITMTERTLREGMPDVAAISPDQKPKLFAMVLEETRPVTQVFTWLAVGSAAMGALGCALLLRRGEPPPRVGSGAVVLGVVVAALGALLFAATRGHARDLDGAWPSCPGGRCRSILSISRDMDEPKKLTHATPLPWAPILEVTRPKGYPRGGVVTLDGHEVAITRELMDELGVSPWSPVPRLLELLKEQVKTRREIEPDRPRPETIILRAHRALRAPTLRPLLATCHRAGFRKLLIATTRIERFKSAVLGDLQTSRGSGLEVRLTTKKSAANLVEMQRESFGTLAYRLNEAAGQGPVALRIAVTD